MNSFLFVFPFLLLQLFQKQSVKDTLRSLPATFAIVPLFTFLPIFPLYPLLFALSIANAIHLKVFNYPLAIGSLKRIRHLGSLKDSVKEEISLSVFLINIFAITYYSMLFSIPSLYTFGFLPLLLLANPKLILHPYQALIPLFKRKRKENGSLSLPKIENETFHKLNKDFPLEKYTEGFSGSKEFSLGKKSSPHVVFIYLESFRDHELGKCTPYFDQLKEDGVYFSNFYANASQTFKAMFATMYGLPPCFGADFTKSSSPVLTLPVRGLPDFFAEKGYTNVFMKGGSKHFEKQGAFLQNHHFQEIYDAKDIKRDNDKAYGSSWGVHDEFLFEFLEKRIAHSSSPLFINAATVTNHHPFILPHNYKPSLGTTPFTKTVEYMDWALFQSIQRLKKLKTPMHLYIMGDHGYPSNHDSQHTLSPSLDEYVTHVPFLIYPINCGKTESKKIETIASQIDILPTMMDLYGFSGLNSSIGSSLCRSRSHAMAYLLNEAITPISGTVDKDSYSTKKGYLDLYKELSKLYKGRKISSTKKDLKVLDFSNKMVGEKTLRYILEKNRAVNTLLLNGSNLIASLAFLSPTTIKKVTLDDNILLTDDDFYSLPKSIESISLKGCRNLTDKTLSILAKLSLKEITLSGGKYTTKGLKAFFRNTKLEKLWIKDGRLMDSCVLELLKDHPLEEISIEGVEGLEDSHVQKINSPSLKLFMCDHCEKLSDVSLSFFKNSSLEVLHMEKGSNITDKGIAELSRLPIHTFYISNSNHVTEKMLFHLKTPFMQNLFCIDCENLPILVKEGKDKQIYLLKKEAC